MRLGKTLEDISPLLAFCKSVCKAGRAAYEVT
jgi:hypothetical protein